MKAQFVYENISFERDKDPKSVMGIGDPDVQAIEKVEDVLHDGFERTDDLGEDGDQDQDIQRWIVRGTGREVLLYRHPKMGYMVYFDFGKGGDIFHISTFVEWIKRNGIPNV